MGIRYEPVRKLLALPENRLGKEKRQGSIAGHRRDRFRLKSSAVIQSDGGASGQDFSLPVCYIVFFSAEFRAYEDYLPAGTEILLIILLVMNLSQSLG